jgi:hypothetical protein
MYKIDIKKISACISGGHNRHNSKSHENGNYCVHHPAAPIAMLDQCCHDRDQAEQICFGVRVAQLLFWFI